MPAQQRSNNDDDDDDADGGRAGCPPPLCCSSSSSLHVSYMPARLPGSADRPPSPSHLKPHRNVSRRTNVFAQASKQSTKKTWNGSSAGAGAGAGAAPSSSLLAAGRKEKMKYVAPPSNGATGSSSSVSPPGKMKYVAPPTNAGEWNRPKVGVGGM